jgi:hypothetical protein
MTSFVAHYKLHIGIVAHSAMSQQNFGAAASLIVCRGMEIGDCPSGAWLARCLDQRYGPNPPLSRLSDGDQTTLVAMKPIVKRSPGAHALPGAKGIGEKQRPPTPLATGPM